MNWPAWLSLCGVKTDTLKHTFTSNQYTLLMQMALLGNGILLGWKHITDPLVASGSLVKASNASASFGGGYYLVWPVDRMETHAMHLFKKWASEHAKNK
jgi:DNA-binding transcriptional LysR family regulator